MSTVTGATTVICAEAVRVASADEVATMVATPGPMPVTRPDWSTVATVGAVLLQTTPEFAKPLTVAASCCVPPTWIEPVAGATTKMIGASTVTTADAREAGAACAVAVIVAVPGATAVTAPAPVTLATAGALDCQLTFVLVVPATAAASV